MRRRNCQRVNLGGWVNGAPGVSSRRKTDRKEGLKRSDFTTNKNKTLNIFEPTANGYESKLSTPVIGWLILKIKLNLWSPRSLILTHTQMWTKDIRNGDAPFD
jgi:hypothetical protein